MNGLYEKGPIIACSTGRTSNSAIAVIRLSGFNSIDDFQKCFSINLSLVSPRHASYCDLLDRNNNTLDSIVLTYFEGPNSYNGENILELSVHGNQINIGNIINYFVEDYNFRIAREGEFTYRALLNKKLSLTEVEGLDLLLNANSSLIFSKGMKALQGDLYDEYSQLRSIYLMLKGTVELSIDFSDDVGDEQVSKLYKQYIEEFDSKVSQLYQRVKVSSGSLLDPKAVLVGCTNAGKSSIFNLLLMNNRSIVSDIAGTTRDYVSENLIYKGTSYSLIDTAGIRETFNEIEKLGIDRSFENLESAFFRILVVNPLDSTPEDYKKLIGFEFDLLVLTHHDQGVPEGLGKFLSKLPRFKRAIYLNLKEKLGPIEPLEGQESGPIEPLENQETGPIEPLENQEAGPIEPELIKTSCLAENIFTEMSDKYLKLNEFDPILIDRHRQLIGSIYSSWKGCKDLIENEDDIAIITSELGLIETELGELIGIITSDNVLNNLFSNFCIGK